MAIQATNFFCPQFRTIGDEKMQSDVKGGKKNERYVATTRRARDTSFARCDYANISRWLPLRLTTTLPTPQPRRGKRIQGGHSSRFGRHRTDEDNLRQSGEKDSGERGGRAMSTSEQEG